MSDVFFQGLKKKELLVVLKKLYFPINYKKNNACNETVYYSSVCARMEQIYKHIRYSTIIYQNLKTNLNMFLQGTAANRLNKIMLTSKLALWILSQTFIQQNGKKYYRKVTGKILYLLWDQK